MQARERERESNHKNVIQIANNYVIWNHVFARLADADELKCMYMVA